MKKIISVLTFFVISASLCGCVFVPMGLEDNSKNNSKVDYSVPAAVIENTVIYEDNGIVVTLSDLTRERFTYTVKNNGENDVAFMFNNVAVNNCVVYDNDCYSDYITPGNSTSGTYNITGFGAYGGGEVKTIDISANICIYEDEYDSFDIYGHVSTSLDDGMVYAPGVSPLIAYEDKNVVLGLVKKGNSIDDLYYYIANKTENFLTVEFGHMSANGQMFENQPILWLNAFPNGYASSQAQYNDSYTLYSAFDEEVKAKGFDNVSKLAANIRVVFRDENNAWIDDYSVDNLTLYEIGDMSE